MKHVDKATVLELLCEVVAEKGEDYVYRPPNGRDECVYVHNGECSCLVARVLHKLGVSIEDLARLDTASEGGGAVAVWQAIEVGLIPGLTFTPEAREALMSAQFAQDGFKTWGEALQAAERAS